MKSNNLLINKLLGCDSRIKRKYVSSGLIIVTLLGSGLIPNIVKAAEVQEHKNNILNMENTGPQGADSTHSWFYTISSYSCIR